MKRNVKTAYGVSKSSYRTNPGDTKQSGKIQDKASVISEWTLTANSMLILYEKKVREAGNFFAMTSADYGLSMEHMVHMFVDDANHIVGCECETFFLVQGDISVTSDFDQEPSPDDSHLPTHTVGQNLTRA